MRKFKYRPRFPRSKFFRRKKKVPASTKKYVKKQIHKQIEDKWLTQVSLQGIQPVLTAPSFFDMCTFPVGPDAQSRLGNKVKMTSIRVRILAQASNILDGQRFRVILVNDTQANGTVAGTFPLISLFADNPSASHYMNSPFHPDFVPSRFKIMYDRLVSMSPAMYDSTTPGAYSNLASVKINKFKRLPVVQYSGTTGTSTDIVKNRIVLIIISDTAAPTIGPTIEVTAVVTFEDA